MSENRSMKVLLEELEQLEFPAPSHSELRERITELEKEVETLKGLLAAALAPKDNRILWEE